MTTVDLDKTEQPANDLFDKAERIERLDALSSSHLREWPIEKLEACLEKLCGLINHTKAMYLSNRKKLIAVHLAMNRAGGRAPALRPTIKVPPKMAFSGEYPEWARAASNDKQLVDLDFVMVNLSKFVNFDRNKYCFFDKHGKYMISSVQDFIWEVGAIPHKLNSLNMPEFVMLLTQSLRTAKYREISNDIRKKCLRYEQLLRQKMISDKRSRLTDSSIQNRCEVFQCVCIANLLNKNKVSDVRFYVKCLTGGDINAGTLSRLIKQINTDCVDAGISLHGK